MLPGFKPNIWEVARRSPRPRFDEWLLTLAYIGHKTWVLNPEPDDNHVITSIINFSYNYGIMKFHHCFHVFMALFGASVNLNLKGHFNG
jgi:hypothetical protein